MSKSIVIVLQEGETHTFYSDRCVLADVERALETPPEVKSEIDSMLAEFEREFKVELEPAGATKGKRKKLEPVSLREYDRFNYRLK